MKPRTKRTSQASLRALHYETLDDEELSFFEPSSSSAAAGAAAAHPDEQAQPTPPENKENAPTQPLTLAEYFDDLSLSTSAWDDVHRRPLTDIMRRVNMWVPGLPTGFSTESPSSDASPPREPQPGKRRSRPQQVAAADPLALRRFAAHNAAAEPDDDETTTQDEEPVRKRGVPIRPPPQTHDDDMLRESPLRPRK